MLQQKIRESISNGINTGISNGNKNMMDVIMSICESYYETPAHNLNDLKLRNMKVKGDIFELFTQLYMRHCYGLPEVWLLNEIPLEIKKELNLGKQDMGIDLVGRDVDGKYYAIQSKYRKRKGNGKICVTWKQLSTFYALCGRTGPYEKYIVFTTADYVRRVGKKTSKDVTIGYHKLKKTTHFQWLEMSQDKGEDLNKEEDIDTNKEADKTCLTKEEDNICLTKEEDNICLTKEEDNICLTKEELRAKRLLFYTS